MDSDLAQISAAGEKDLNKVRGKFSSSPSGLSDDKKQEIKDDLNKIISKINVNDASSLDSKFVNEQDLVFLLRKSAGSQKEKIKSDNQLSN